MVLALGLILGWFVFSKNHSVSYHLTVYGKGKPLEVMTKAKTVGEALRDQGISLKPQDLVVPSLSAPVSDDMEIDLGLVERKVKELKKAVPYDTHTDYVDTMNVGEIIDVQLGKDGLEDQQIESF